MIDSGNTPSLRLVSHSQNAMGVAMTTLNQGLEILGTERDA